MPSPREFIFGPWRAVSVLGVTQILTWGAMFYPPVLTVPLIAADRGWSIAFAMGGFSLALFVGGLVSRYIGAYIDRFGGHAVMPFGSLIGTVSLFALVHAEHWIAYLAVWMMIGVAMAANLYDPAFATLGRVFGGAARRPITALTLIGGFASTVSWPVTHVLLEAVGWRGTYLVYAALLACVAAPLHAFALPRTRAAPIAPTGGASAAPAAVLPASGMAFLLVAAAFAAYAFVPSALSAHLLAIFGRAGIDATTVVAIGTLFGPAQVLARICEFTFARNVHPLWVGRFAIGLLVLAFVLLWIGGIVAVIAGAFALMFGAANGLLTIARGALPLALFGPDGYGRVIGRIGGLFLIVQSMAPLVVAFVVEQASDRAALVCVAAFAVVAFTCFALIRRPSA